MSDPELDADRRAWHRALATTGPDEDVAAELERSAGRAQARGGLAAAAAFLQRSVELTPDPARRSDRALAAAQACMHAGAFDVALGLLATAEAGPLDELGRARVALLRGQIAFTSGLGSEAPPLLLEAAQAARAAGPWAGARDLSERPRRSHVRRVRRGGRSAPGLPRRQRAPPRPRGRRAPSTCC